ncbi:MAG: hypothetical protein OXS29_16600 [bacterium]|nr:hypothetical protein [bacterium]MDE0289653.1 hypothetical protein [bacterium]MDE0437927.1 hypothetical protein [bacterium]
MRFEQFIPLLVVAALVVAACSRDGEEAPETTVAPAATTATTSAAVADAAGSAGDTTVASEPADPDADAAPGESAETTTVATVEVVAGLPSYEVVHRMIEDDRETLVVVVEPGTYSNVQLENLVYDVVERFTPSAVIVVDDRDVADLAVLEERTDEQQDRLDAHTFLRIEGGVEVTFYGPYADFPGLTVGS